MPGADHPPAFLTVLAGFSWLGLRTFFQHQVIGCFLGALGIGAMDWPAGASPASGSASSPPP